MPTVTFDKKTVLKYLGKKVPDTVLKDRISMLGTDLERVDDTEIVVEIFPNRPDMLSEEGFARALSSFMGIKTGLIKYDVKKSGSFTKVEKTLKIWPYVVTGIVRGLKFDDEKIRALIQLQEKLGITMCRKRRKGGIGIYPLDKIKLPITFTTMNADKIKFRPLEYPDEITGREILEKHPTGREYGHIIEKQKEFPVFIDASGKIMSMPPAINSHDIGKITEATSDIFLEATGPDFVTLMQAINIISSALADAGGKVYSMDVIYKGKTITTPNLAPSKMKIDIKYINKLLGMEFSEKELNALLAKMGFGHEKGSVLVPAYRTDILHPIDIVEDIAIAYGYENFAEEIPNVSTIGTESKSAIFQRKVAEVMVGFSFLECMSYHLSNKEVLVSKMNSSNTKVVHVSNAVNAEYGVLRQGILPGLMKILSENTLHEYPQKLFEIGETFNHDLSSETGTSESLMLAGVVATKSAGFTEAKAIVEGLFRATGKECAFKATKNHSFLEGRSAEILCNGKSIGIVGEMHPEVISNFGIEMPVTGFEISLDAATE